MEYLGFYMKHGDQLKALFASGENHILLDLVCAVVPVIKKHYPQLNENDLLDDAVDLFKHSLG